VESPRRPPPRRRPLHRDPRPQALPTEPRNPPPTRHKPLDNAIETPPPDQDLADEALAILALGVGLGNAILSGRRSPDDARRVLARHLDHRLGPPR
jgi:hypothetical protein